MASTTAPAGAITPPLDSTRGTSTTMGSRLSSAATWVDAKFWSFLTWYTSFLYWGTGVALGLTQGYLYLITTYTASLLAESFHFFDRNAPVFVEEAAAGRKTPFVPAPTPKSKATAQAAAQAAKEKVQEALAAVPLPHITPQPKPLAAPVAAPASPGGYKTASVK